MDRIDPTSPPGARRTIAVGILGRRAGRTISTVRTAAGVTGVVRRDSHTPVAPAPAVTA
ncbi:hypothetical protein [Streptomyces cucumeris]|uniref:hypothetical protein n=1 Tax=Streptomyces cucumeris TaxID=2962890 RepID=UPI0020C83D0B|nr:hypothetical protein [Streptomyces sp. NEAU-Y11]MCP9205525.1 hypothetical protein [Streptomyces sp. NEAU-Y11]